MPRASTRLYDLLGVVPSASPAEIKKAYRKLALEHHPDRGGSTKTFQDISAAYQVLSSDEQRALYDQYGEEGLREGGGQAGAGPGGASAADLFGNLFGDLFGGSPAFGGSSNAGRGFASQRRRRPQKPRDRTVKVRVTLNELYAGVTKHLELERTVPCASCHGSGTTRPDAERVCAGCDGQGARVTTRVLGPGMVQQVQHTCPTCAGAGRTVAPEHLCGGCRGRKVQQQRAPLGLTIPAGSSEDQGFVLRGAGDQLPGLLAQDVVCVLEVGRHPSFTRRGDHLLVTRRITLAEALGGCAAPLEHLDGRRLLLRSRPREIIKPGAWRRVRHEGMPVFEKPLLRGDLLVQFDILFPEELDAATARQLAGALVPPRPATQPSAGLWDRLLQFFRRAPASGQPEQDAGPRAPPEHDGVVAECFLEAVQGLDGTAPGGVPRSRL